MTDTQSVMVKNRAGQLVDITNSEVFARTVLEIIPNPVVRAILLGTKLNVTNVDKLVMGLTENQLGGETGVINFMRSIVNLAFITAITRWKQTYDDPSWAYPEIIEEFKNSRYSKIFQSALSKEDITLDLQIFALIELWVGIKKSNDDVRGQFANIFKRKGENLGLTLQAVADAIKNAGFSTLHVGKYDLPYCNKLCYKLLTSFPFLREVDITYPADPTCKDKHAFCISYPLPLDVNEDGEYAVLYPNDFYVSKDFVITEQQLRHLVREKRQEEDDSEYESPNSLVLYLLSEVSAFAGELQYTYRSLDDQYEGGVIDKEDASEDFPKVDPNEIQEMRKFMSFNYRNIRELAIIISDSIKDSPEKKKEIFDLCKQRNSKIIPTDIKSSTDTNIYWDNVITIMLVEMGPSDFLEFVIDEKDAYKQGIYEDIIDNIEWRYADHDVVAEMKAEYQKEYNELVKKYANSSSSTGALRSAAVSLRARKVLQVLGITMEENHSKSSFEEDLTFKFETIKTCVNTLIELHNNPGSVDNVTEKKKQARLTLIETFRNIFLFLQVFYEALDAYAVEKQDLEAHPNLELSEEDRRKKNRKSLYDTFAKKAAEKYEEIYTQTLSEAFEGFCKLCKQYNTYATGGDFSVSDRAKNLKYLITRNYICDESKLRYFVTVNQGKENEFTIFEMLETYKAEYVEHPDFTLWHTYFYDLFLFLIYNEDYYDRGVYLKQDVLEDKDYDPIYPYIVTYYKENTDRDNFKKCVYRVPIPTSRTDASRDQGYVVTLLTEDELIGKSYFCIPLRYGSTEKWWINPLMIPMRPIRKMKEHLKEKNISLK